MAATLLSPPTPLKLQAQTAADLMVPNPISLPAESTLEQAMTLFTEKGIAAAPVIDEGGRPIGVISRSDIFIHQVEDARRQRPDYFHSPEGAAPSPKRNPGPATKPTHVADVMTPAVFAVGPDTHVGRVVSDMVGLHVHRLFVVDGDGVLVGVITAMDVLKHLRT